MTEKEFNAMTHRQAKAVLRKDAPSDPVSDPVNHPKHYEYAGFQVIDIIKAVMPAEWFNGFLLGNVIKYVLRAFRKNGVEDFKKARWYLDRLIQSLDEK